MTQAKVTAAVLIIGDEILSGRTQDTNLNAIAKMFGVHGVDLSEARVVPDVTEEIVDALNVLRRRYDYVVTTGGIGPTHDDITADCVALAFGLELYEHPDIIAGMQADTRYEVTEARRRMARVPHGATLVKNPIKGPPGFQIENVFVLAGVPTVMRGMLEDVGHRLLGAVAKAHPDMSLGSYPFFSHEGFGSNLVVRGRVAAEVDAVVEELAQAMQAAGVDKLTRVEG